MDHVPFVNQEQLRQDKGEMNDKLMHQLSSKNRMQTIDDTA